MARRKPSGIIDVVKDIVSPWLGAPPAQNKQVTQAQGLARAAAETLDQTFAGGFVKAGVQGNKALVKQAAVNVAALGTGYVAGKAAVTAVGAVAKTGVPARVVNKITNQQVMLHSSPRQKIRTVNPYAGAAIGNKDPLVFLRRPDLATPHMTSATMTYTGTDSLAAKAGWQKMKGSMPAAAPGGSVYVTKTSNKNLKKAQTLFGDVSDVETYVSTRPLKVVKEIPVPFSNTKEAATQIVDVELRRALKRFGVKNSKRR